MSVYMEFSEKKEGDAIERPPLFEGRKSFDDGEEHINIWTGEILADNSSVEICRNIESQDLEDGALSYFADGAGKESLYKATPMLTGVMRNFSTTYIASYSYGRTGNDEDYQHAIEQLKNGATRLGASLPVDKSMVFIVPPKFMSVHRFKDDVMTILCRIRVLAVSKDEASRLLAAGCIDLYSQDDAHDHHRL